MKNKINKIIHEQLKNYLTESKKLDLFKIFDLSKIPQEELERQYYDVSILHCMSPYGFLSEDEDKRYVFENDARVVPAEEVEHELRLKYNFRDWQLEISKRGHDVNVCICVGNFPNGVNEVVKDMEQMGYFLSYSAENKFFGQNWKMLQFEPRFQMNEFEEIVGKGDIMHLTPRYNVENILKNGLVPKSENYKFKYPNRVYFFMGDTPYPIVNKYGKKFCKNSKNPLNDGVYVLLSIDTNKLRESGIQLFYDPNMEYGCFTEEPIPADFITPLGEFNYDKSK